MCAKKAENRSFKAFMTDLKAEKINNAVLMYGPEQYLVKWAVDMVKAKYVNAAAEAMDYLVLEDEDATPEAVIEACETFSMLSEKRVIWVRDYKLLRVKQAPRGFTEEGIKALAEYIENSNPKSIVIFSSEEIDEKSPLTAAVKKAGSRYNFVRLSDAELKSFANKRFRDAGVEIKPYIMSQLINATGYNNKESDYRLYNFENDIRKVIAHADGAVTEKDINEAISGDSETFIFDLIDGVSGNNKKRALEVLYNRLHVDSYDTPRIIGTIASQMELMYEIKEFLESSDGPETAEEISKYTGSNIYRVKNVMRYANKYTLEKLREMLTGIYETDVNIKTGIMEPQMALELFVARI